MYCAILYYTLLSFICTCYCIVRVEYVYLWHAMQSVTCTALARHLLRCGLSMQEAHSEGLAVTLSSH
jgi:hypothetical protein